ncbi:MAG: hypothetical protein WD688_23735 [Candidatus Binatia bacterium]
MRLSVKAAFMAVLFVAGMAAPAFAREPFDPAKALQTAKRVK